MADILNIPADRTDLIALFGIIFTLTALFFIILVIQRVRRKPSAKMWAVIFIISTIISLFIVIMTRTNDVPSLSEIEEKKLNTTIETTSPPPNDDSVDTSVSYEEIYTAYKQNELRADELYQYNRYRVTAKINGMESGGLFNLTGGATLTMETKIGNTIVFFYAEFEKEQEEKLKGIEVGNTITFDGKCLGAGTWTECEIVKE